MVPFEVQPGVFEQRFARYELWPNYNPNCYWNVKAGNAEKLLLSQVFNAGAVSQLVQQIGLDYTTVQLMSAVDAANAFDAAMSGYTEKQRADWYAQTTNFLGSVFEPADNYVVPIQFPEALLEIRQQGTRVVRGPFASPRHVIELLLSAQNLNIGIKPATVDVLLGCDENGSSAAATVRMRVIHLAAHTTPLAGTASLKSHAMTSKFFTNAGDSASNASAFEIAIVVELLDKNQQVVDTARIITFPGPYGGQQAINPTTFRQMCLRLSISTSNGIAVEGIFDQFYVDDSMDSGTMDQDYSPPLRHLFERLDGDFDVSMIGVFVSQSDQLTVRVNHRPMETSSAGTPEFFAVPQGGSCATSAEAQVAMAAGVKTLCTLWSRSCHVTHAAEGQCFTELDVAIAGNPIQFAGFPNNIFNLDLGAVLQGSFTLGNLSADGESLWHNSFWFNDDEPFTVGNARRTKIELSATIGAHWPVPVCIGNERPVEIALFGRAAVKFLAAPQWPEVLPAGFDAGTEYSMYFALWARVSQRLLLGEKCSPEEDYRYDGAIYWDRDFPWGSYFWWTSVNKTNSMKLDLTQCEFQLR